MERVERAAGPAQALEMALDIALIVVRSGGTTNMADRAFRNILKGFRQEGGSTAWRLDVVTASGVVDGRPAVIQRLVGIIEVNLVRVSESVILSERVAHGNMDPASLASEVERVGALATHYGRWAMMAAAVCAAGSFSQVCGGDGGSFGISCAAVAIGQFFRPVLRARSFTVVSTTLICGLLSACIAGAGLRLGWSQVPWVTLISSVIYLAPGLPLINGFIEMATHTHLFAGMERIANALLLFLVLAVDIAFAYTVIL